MTLYLIPDFEFPYYLVNYVLLHGYRPQYLSKGLGSNV